MPFTLGCKIKNSIIKFGQFVRHQWQQKGLPQLQLSSKVFHKPNVEYISRLERGVAGGITFATPDKIMVALGSELEFRKFEIYTPDLHKKAIRF